MLKKKSTSTSTITSNSTSTISISNNSGGTLTTSSGGNVNYVTTGYSFTTAKYHILGEDFETNGYLDGTTVIMISTLNVLGKPFYEELKKNNVSFPNDMDEFIQQRLKVLDRDKKIDSIIKDNP
jgi:hypothetical protein